MSLPEVYPKFNSDQQVIKWWERMLLHWVGQDFYTWDSGTLLRCKKWRGKIYVMEER